MAAAVVTGRGLVPALILVQVVRGPDVQQPQEAVKIDLVRIWRAKAMHAGRTWESKQSNGCGNWPSHWSPTVQQAQKAITVDFARIWRREQI